MASDRITGAPLPPWGLARAAAILHRLVGDASRFHKMDRKHGGSATTAGQQPAGSRSGEGADSVLPYLITSRH
jgi:hypothetical protein